MTPEASPPAIAITAATVTGNHGAEAMLLATVGRLRDRIPGATFNVFSYYPDADRAAVRAADVQVFSLTPLRIVTALVPLAAAHWLVRRLGLSPLLPLFPRDIRALAASAVQVDLAGVSFVDGRERFLPFNVLSLVPALLVGVPVVKLSQALGPFSGRLNRAAAMATLRRCRAVFSRGDRTHAHLRELAPATDVRRAEDVAFLLEAQDGLTAPASHLLERLAARIAVGRRQGRRVVGVCPSSLLATRYPGSYPDLIRSFIGSVTEQGDQVLLFPNATRATPEAGPRNNDLHVIRRILKALPPEVRDGVVAVEEDVHAVDLVRVVDLADVTVVSRFHAMVASLSLARPTVVVGWSHKYQEVMETFGLGDFVYQASLTDAGVLAAALRTLEAQGGELQDDLAHRLDEVRASALTQVDYVAGLVAP